MKRKLRKTTALLSAMAVSAGMLLNIPGSMLVNAEGEGETTGHTHDYTNNGICSADGECDAKYEKPGDADNYGYGNGYLDITNAGNLIWFANSINDGSATTKNAELTTNITIPTDITWTPIGSAANAYTGIFNGHNYTISGLNITPESAVEGIETPVYGLFGYSTGTIENLGVVESKITGTVAENAGIICGENGTGGTIKNCYSQGATYNSAKGISGTNNGTIKNCYTTAGSITDGTAATNSYYLVTESSEEASAKTEDQFKSGAVAYALENKQTTEDASVTPVWGQTIDKEGATKQNYPVLGGERVYQNTANDGTVSYSNEKKEATSEVKATITGYSATVFDVNSIQLNVNFALESITSNDIEVTCTGKDLKTNVDDSTGTGTASISVVAKDIATDFEFKIKMNGAELATGTFSVEGYLKDLEKSDSAKYSDLAKALIAYGNAAKQYFNDETVDAVDCSADFSEYAMVLNGTLPTGVEYIGTSLLLNSQTSMRHYFKLANANTEFTVNGGTAKTATKYAGSDEGIYYVDVAGISPVNMASNSTVKVGNATLEYSVLSYANTVVSGSDKNLANLAKALYNYYEAASAINPRV